MRRRSKNPRTLQLRVFRCPVCRETIVAPKRLYMTGVGHVKTMWCWRCKDVRDFKQVE